MKTKKSISVLMISLFSLLNICSYAQEGLSVNITGAPSDNSAMLDVSSTSKGTLLTRLTTVQRNSITSPAQSLLIFNITTQCFEYFDNGIWQTMFCSCSPPSAPISTAGSGATSTQITANWNAAPGAAGYYLDVSDDDSFTSFVSGCQNLNVSNVTTFDVTGLSCGTDYYYRVRAYNTCGTSGNSDTITYSTSSCGFSCGSVLTDIRDSKTYGTVQIGTQCWMSVNLDYGTYVPVATGGQSGGGTQKYCTNLSGSNDPLCPMGGLYEWAEIMNGASGCNGTCSNADCDAPGDHQTCSTPVQGICPSGWHIPSHHEWTLFERNIGSNPGGFPYDNSTQNWLGTDEGGNMRVTPICGALPCWNSPNTGATNSSGFSALPGGYSFNGSFGNYGVIGQWWSCSTGTTAWKRSMNSTFTTIYRGCLADLTAGYSVRCVMD